MRTNRKYTTTFGEKMKSRNFYGYNHNGYLYSGDLIGQKSQNSGQGFRRNHIVLLELNLKAKELTYYKINDYQTDRIKGK